MRVTQLALLSLKRRPVSSLIGVLCVALAVLACGTLVSILAGKTAAYDDLHSDFNLIVGPKCSGVDLLLGALGVNEPSDDVIPYALISAILRRMKPVHWVPLLGFAQYEETTVYATNRQFFLAPEGITAPKIVSGATFTIPLGAGSQLVAGTTATDAAGEIEPNLRKRAVIGVRAAERTGLKVGDRFTITGRWKAENYEETWMREISVVGIIDHNNGALNEGIFVDMAIGWEHYGWAVVRNLVRYTQRLEATTYLLLSVTEKQAQTIQTTIHNNSVAQLVGTHEEISFLSKIVGGVRLATHALSLCVLILVSTVMGILANMRFESLRPELGLLRAIGYPRSAVMGCLALEVQAVACAGILLSVVAEAILIGALDLPARFELTASSTPWPTLWNVAIWLGAGGAGTVALLTALGRLYRTQVQTLLRGL